MLILILKLFISTSFAQSDVVPRVQCDLNSKGPVSKLSSTVKTCTEDYLCNLKIGKPINVDTEKQYSRPQYRLTKTSEKTYLAEINLVFSEVWDGDRQITNRNKMWSTKVQRCLNKYNPYLQGPDGESLKIKLSAQAPRVVINVQEALERIESNVYSDKMQCPAVLHEVLHLLGLADEYKETQVGYSMNKVTGALELVWEGAEIPAYDCRAMGPEDSVMNTETLAVEEVLSKNRSTKKSLLAPGEFKVITDPFCESKNSKYNECVRFAYDTSLAHEDKKCTPAAVECQKNFDWLK